MKNKKKYILRTFAIMLIVGASITVFSQPPPPPEDSGNTQGNKLGGNAPIGGGLFILLGLGAAYGGRKIYYIKSKTTKN
jgi:hypothetical protein